MRRRVNVRLLLNTLAALALLVFSVHLLHAFQIERQSAALLRQAVLAEQEGELDRSAGYFNVYLAHVPGDTNALARYGAVLARRAVSERDRYQAYDVLEQVSRREPNRRDVLEQLVHLSLALYRYSAAARHLEALRPGAPDPADVCSALGWAYLGARDYDRAAEAFTEATQHAPKQLDNYLQLADLYARHLNQADRARQMLDDMVAANPRSATALLVRARWREARDQIDEAAADLARAEEVAPDDPAVPLAAAEFALRRERLDEARKHLEHGFRMKPDDPRLHEAAAGLYWQAGKWQLALGHLRSGLAKAPEDARLLMQLAENLLERGQEQVAAAVRQKLARTNPPQPWTDYLDALAAMHRKDWLAAVHLLEKARREQDTVVPWAGRLELARARCYERCGDPVRRLAAARAALRCNGNSVVARAELAAALRQVGRVDDAVELGRDLVQRPDAPASAWVELGRALTAVTRRQPPGERNWVPVEDVCQFASKKVDGPTPVLLLAEVRVAQGRFQEAEALLERACDHRPGELELWTTRADLAAGRDQFVAAGDVLDEAAKRFGDRADLRAARARLLVRDGLAAGGDANEARAGLTALGAGLDRFPRDEQAPVFQALTAAWAQLGDLDQAVQTGRRWVERVPYDLPGWLVLFDLGRAAGDDTLMQEALAGTRRVEGDDSARWRCGEAWRRIEAARRLGDNRLDEAHRFLNEAARLEPDWGRIYLLKAYVAELENRPEQALDQYLRAFDRGERDLGALLKLIDLLKERGRVAEADRVLRRLQQEVPDLGLLTRPAAEVALRLRHFRRALELARQVAPQTSRDYRDHLWLAHVLEEAEQQPEAIDVLREATERFPDSPGCWVARIQVLCRAGRTREAAAVLRQAERHLATTGSPLHLARCYEALGQTDEAESRYKAALEADPLDPFTLDTVARFYLRLDRPAAAIPILRTLLSRDAGASSEQTGWARRELALALASAGTEEAVRGALATLTPRSSTDAVADQRTRALVLSIRPDRRREALNLFEETLPRRPLAPDEQYHLALLYESANDRPRARELMLSLLAKDDRNPQWLAAYVRALLGRDQPAEAEHWLTMLEKVEPDSPRTRALRAELARKEADM